MKIEGMVMSMRSEKDGKNGYGDGFSASEI